MKSIFIIGTGRSGTHWLGYILEAHPQIRVTIERRPIFPWVTEMALDPSRVSKLFPRVLLYYKFQGLLSTPRHYADKSHPNLWIAEPLAYALPNAYFIGIQRNPYATVASMLRHTGVMYWHQHWRAFPVPNAFLGITNANCDEYDALAPAAKCALRWRAHKEKFAQLAPQLGARLKIVSYESLIQDPAPILRALQEFLELDSPIPMPTIKAESLDKWKSQLSTKAQREIQQIVEMDPVGV